jgi:hypothetical protein
MALLVACDDSPTDEEEDPADAIATLRITLANITVSMRAEDGNIASGPTSFVIGSGSHVLTAAFLDQSGQPVAGLTDFELRVTPVNAALVTFARTGAFSGTVTRVAAGTTRLKVGLWHTEEGHFDIGEFEVQIIVQ